MYTKTIEKNVNLTENFVLKDGRVVIIKRLRKEDYEKNNNYEFVHDWLNSVNTFLGLEFNKEDIENDEYDAILKINFVDDDKTKRADININDHLVRIDQEKKTYEKNIDAWIEEENNFPSTNILTQNIFWNFNFLNFLKVIFL